MIERWPGFSFTVPKLVELIQFGLSLLEQQGITDVRRFRRVCLMCRRAGRYCEVMAIRWRCRQVDPCGGLFFWGANRLQWPWAKVEGWSWQTPRDPGALNPQTCFHLRRITDTHIDIVLRALRNGVAISTSEFLFATLHLSPPPFV